MLISPFEVLADFVSAASYCCGEKIEAYLKASIPNIGLTTHIKANSPVLGRSAGERLSFFYLIIGAILAITASFLLKA